MRSTYRRLGAAVAAAGLVVALGACSSQGGKRSEEAGSGVNAGRANTPQYTFAMVTHSAQGDTFWDIVQKGAKVAAQKDNVKFLYSNDPDGSKQAQLVETAINQHVDGLVVTLAKPEAMKASVEKAEQAGIPVVTINSGAEQSAAFGALSHFGQDEEIAGEGAGEQLNKMGASNAICVIHEQGNVGLEARCAGAKKTFHGNLTNVNVDGTNMPSVQSTISAKLQADKSIDAVLTLGAPFALTAVKSVSSVGSDAKVATFDLNKDLVKAIQDGDITFAVDQQPYLQGYLGIDALWLYKTNGDVIGGGRPVLTGPAIVTRDNVDSIAKYAEQGTR